MITNLAPEMVLSSLDPAELRRTLRAALLLLSFAFGLGVSVPTWLLPTWHAWQQAQREGQAHAMAAATVAELEQSLHQQQQQEAQARQSLALTQQRVWADAGVDQLLATVAQLARSRRLRVDSLRPEAVADAHRDQRQSLLLRVTGPYAQHLALLESLAAMQPLIAVQHWSLAASSQEASAGAPDGASGRADPAVVMDLVLQAFGRDDPGPADLALMGWAESLNNLLASPSPPSPVRSPFGSGTSRVATVDPSNHGTRERPAHLNAGPAHEPNGHPGSAPSSPQQGAELGDLRLIGLMHDAQRSIAWLRSAAGLHRVQAGDVLPGAAVQVLALDAQGVRVGAVVQGPDGRTALRERALVWQEPAP